YRESDDWHQAATRGWQELRNATDKLFTSNIVIIEAANILSAIRGARWVAEHANGWFQSRELQVLRATAEDELQANELMRKFADQKIGLGDCVSFILMKRLRIRRAFAF